MGPIAHVRRAARRRPHADIAMAALLYGVILLTTVAGPPAGRGDLDPYAATVAAVACGALVFRHRWPLSALVLSGLGAEFYLAAYQGHEGALVLAAPLIGLYTMTESSGRRRALVVGAVVVLALAGTHMWVKPTSWIGADNLALAAFGALAVAAGDAARNRRAYLAEVEDKVRRLAGDRDREARRQVTEERLRIARDLHDAVGHQLALISVEAGVTAHVLADRAPEVREALSNIRAASRCALEELRDTIGLLRGPDEPAAPVEPAVGLAGLAALVASVERSGLRVDQGVTGEVRALAPAADLTAYRVIQESLTNVCKHAGTGAARLRLDYLADELRIVVDNDGAVAPDPGTGHGLVGMRERLGALGGSLRAGPRLGGGFRLEATLPLARDLGEKRSPGGRFFTKIHDARPAGTP
jgi:signal transduction histidine kinase